MGRAQLGGHPAAQGQLERFPEDAFADGYNL